MFGPKYVANTYNENEVYNISGTGEYSSILYESITGTYIMEFPELNGLQCNLIKYTFKNNIPIKSIKCLKNSIHKENIINDLKNNTTNYKNYYTIDKLINVWSDDINHTYYLNKLPYVSQEERYRVLVDNRASTIGRILGNNPFYFYLNPDKEEFTDYTIDGKTYKVSNELQLLYNYGLISAIPNSTKYPFNPEYIDCYFQSTKTPRTTNPADGLYISIVPIVELTNYNYKMGVNNNINPKISKYLTSVILDENGMTRGLSHLYDIQYKKYGATSFALSQSIGVQTFTSNPPYSSIKISGYIPNTYIIPNRPTEFGYFGEYLYSKILVDPGIEDVENSSKLNIPSSMTSMSYAFTGSSKLTNYNFINFENNNKLTNYAYFFSDNINVSR